jgi:hypothetical protein
MEVPGKLIKKGFINQDCFFRVKKNEIFLGEITDQHPVISPTLGKEEEQGLVKKVK